MAASDNLKLELVQVLFRHGARTCCKTEATIPMPAYVDQSFHKTYGYGQLTNIGKAQLYRLGGALRERYKDFLASDARYRPDVLYACSSDTDRTKMSLQLVLAGLYPPSATEQIWHPELDWMPVSCHYVPREVDILFKSFDISKRFKQLLNEAKNLPEVQEKKAKVLEMSEFFEDKNIDSIKKYQFMAAMGIFNVLYVHKAANLPIPDWCTDDLLDRLRNHFIDLLDIVSLTTEMKRLNGGPLVKRFMENMNINNTVKNPRKIYLYSGHEFNIGAFTRAHNIQTFKYPFFGSAVILEKLRDSQNQLYVRLLGWNGTDDKFVTLKLGDFEEFCPINEYLKIIENVIPSDEEINAMYSDANLDLKTILTTDFVFRSEYEP